MKDIGVTPWWTRAIVAATSIYVFGAGLITFLGWVLDRPRLTDWIDSGISAFPNAAICAAFGAIALWGTNQKHPAAWKNVTRVLAVIVALIGIATLTEHLLDVNFGIDTLLFNRLYGQAASAAPMRMGPPASSSFALIGAALLLTTFTTRLRRVANVLAIVCAAIASLSLVGYWYGADRLFGIARLTGIALQTTSMLAGLSLGLIFSIPEFGLMSIIVREDAGGFLARRLLLPSIVFPLVIGWLRILGQNARLFDTAFGTSAMVLTTSMTVLTCFSITASWLGRGAWVAGGSCSFVSPHCCGSNCRGRILPASCIRRCQRS